MFVHAYPYTARDHLYRVYRWEGAFLGSAHNKGLRRHLYTLPEIRQSNIQKNKAPLSFHERRSGDECILLGFVLVGTCVCARIGTRYSLQLYEVLCRDDPYEHRTLIGIGGECRKYFMEICCEPYHCN
jgi:hypothetical protein